MLNTSKKETALPPGKKFLIGIGIDKYIWAPPLRNAVKDLNDIHKRLIEQYDFDTDNVRLLTDEQATRENIFQLLDDFTKPDVLASNDSLLIYFSGHGYLNHNQQGSWVPVDGKIGVVSSMIQNVNVQDYIAQFKCRHVLLISDSCYSGSLQTKAAFTSPKNSMADELERKESRYVLSSGRADETTLDSTVANPENSPFAGALLSTLKNNYSPKLLADKLFDSVRDITYNNSPQLPQFQVVSNTGDHGGRFVFTLRDPEPGAWEQAERDKTTKTYESFITEFPNSKHRKLAEERISDILNKQDTQQTYEQIQLARAKMSPPEKANDILTLKTRQWGTNKRSLWYILNFTDWRYIESQRKAITDWGEDKETKKALLQVSKRWWLSWMTVGMLIAVSGLAYTGFYIWQQRTQGGAFYMMKQQADEYSQSENEEKKFWGIKSVALAGQPAKALKKYESLPVESKNENVDILTIISQEFLRLKDTNQANLLLEKFITSFDELSIYKKKEILDSYIKIGTRKSMNKALSLSLKVFGDEYNDLLPKIAQKYDQLGDARQAQKARTQAQKGLIKVINIAKREGEKGIFVLQSNFGAATLFYNVGDTLYAKTILALVWKLLLKGPAYYSGNLTTLKGFSSHFINRYALDSPNNNLNKGYAYELSSLIYASTRTNYKPSLQNSLLAIDFVDKLKRPGLLVALSQSYAKFGDKIKAKLMLDKALYILNELPPEIQNQTENWNKTNDLLDIALGFFQLNDRAKAESIIKSSIPIIDSIQVSEQGQAFLNIATAYNSIGDKLSAKRLMRQSLQSVNEQNLEDFMKYNPVVRNYVQLGDREGLRLLLVKAYAKPKYATAIKDSVANGFASLSDLNGLELILSKSSHAPENLVLNGYLLTKFAQLGDFKLSLRLIKDQPADEKAIYLYKALYTWQFKHDPEDTE